eukprot:690773-Pleurochrysis_carterae.AAC.4
MALRIPYCRMLVRCNAKRRGPELYLVYLYCGICSLSHLSFARARNHGLLPKKKSQNLMGEAYGQRGRLRWLPATLGIASSSSSLARGRAALAVKRSATGKKPIHRAVNLALIAHAALRTSAHPYNRAAVLLLSQWV